MEHSNNYTYKKNKYKAKYIQLKTTLNGGGDIDLNIKDEKYNCYYSKKKYTDKIEDIVYYEGTINDGSFAGKKLKNQIDDDRPLYMCDKKRRYVQWKDAPVPKHLENLEHFIADEPNIFETDDKCTLINTKKSKFYIHEKKSKIRIGFLKEHLEKG